MTYTTEPDTGALGPCWRIFQNGMPLSYPLFYEPDSEAKARAKAADMNAALGEGE